MSKRKSKITYEMIEPLILMQEVEGNNVYVEFALPGSDEVFESKSPIKTAKTAGNRIKKRMGMMAKNQARRAVTKTVRSALGGGIIGRSASMATHTAAREVNVGGGFSDGDIQAAVLTAFGRVSMNFYYDEDLGEWREPSAAPPPPPKSPFETQCEQHPIADPHDKNVFARVMAELAYADGQISKEESAFFKDIIPPDQPSLDQLAKSDPVSKIEAEEVTEGVKGTIFMFAWVIALIDLDLDPVEEELLMEYADVFELQEGRAQELIRNAKFFVMEQNIDPDIQREELFHYAEKIRLSEDDAERCRIAYKRRMG